MSKFLNNDRFGLKSLRNDSLNGQFRIGVPLPSSIVSNFTFKPIAPSESMETINMSCPKSGIVYSQPSKMNSVFPLPYEIREMIYDEAEPDIIIEPQYPINIRKALEPGWDPGYKTHPMLGISTFMDDDILSRYYNRNERAQTQYLPEKTTFRIWATKSRLMNMHMATFFDINNGNNCYGVRHLEYMFDGYRADHEGLLELLKRFPNLKTLKVELRYDAGRIDGEAAENFMNLLKLCLKLLFMCKYTRGTQGVKWEVREFCVLEGEEY